MNTICLEGIRVGSIETIVDVKSILGADDAFVVTEDKIRMITRQAGLEGHYPFTGEPFWKVIFHVLTADRSAISSRVSEDYRQRYFAEFSQCNSDLLPNERLEDLPAAACAEISKTLDAIIEDKVLFIMKEGYVGLGQEGFEVTDVVGILVGGETPFAFRASSVAGCGRFRFLSECYVHGVMDGELAGSFSKGYSRFSIE
jgi:hypothetical protein